MLATREVHMAHQQIPKTRTNTFGILLGGPSCRGVRCICAKSAFGGAYCAARWEVGVSMRCTAGSFRWRPNPIGCLMYVQAARHQTSDDPSSIPAIPESEKA